MREVRAEAARGDRVVVPGITLCFTERRDAAAAALGHVGKFRAAAVESRNERFRCNGHFMRRPIAEVDDLLRMIQRVARIAIVSRVAADRGIAAAYAGRQCADTDTGAAPKAAVARSAQLAVPVGRREPDFNLDFGIARWPGDGGDTAERRQIVEAGAPSLASAASGRRGEGTRGN